MAELEIVRASHGEKAEAVAFVHEKFKTAKMAIVTEYRGLSVAQMTRLRRAIRDASGEYQVIKNTLVRRALKDTAYGSLDRLLDGPNGWVFAYDDPVMLSKALVKFADDNDKLAIKGGVFDAKAMSADEIRKLADLESRETLLAKLAGAKPVPVVSRAEDEFVVNPDAIVAPDALARLLAVLDDRHA